MKINFENEIKELALKYETGNIYKLKEIITKNIEIKNKEKEILKKEIKKSRKIDIWTTQFLIYSFISFALSLSNFEKK